jgi:hydantoinase/carbamoylase family amidase
MIGIASGVWAGVHSLETGWTCQEIKANKDGRRHSVKEELERIGFLGQTPASFEANPMAAHFELHIEQGPILENEGRKIGVVTGAQAYKWFQIRVRGRDSHAGTTPFNARQDAVLAAAKMIVESNQIARDRAGLVTTGNVNVEPGSMNTTAHTVQFTMDMRHPSDGMLSEIEDTCRRRFAEIAKTHSEKGVTVEWTQLTDSPAVTFHDDCISAVQGATEEVCAALPKTSEMDSLWMPMVSGAGHDSCYTNRMCPTGMIFTPTKDGLSHTPTEYCSPEECALGAQVLLGAVLRYDKMRAEKGLL